MRGRLPLREERGITMVEVLVAAFIVTMIVIAGTSVFANGEDVSGGTQRESALISVADQQMETIRDEVKTHGFAELAMQSAPVSLPGSIPNRSPFSTLKEDPSAFATAKTGCGGSNEELSIEANYDNTAEGIAANPQHPTSNGFDGWSGCDAGTEPLLILGSTTGFVVAQQQVSVGSDTAVVDTFVTDTYAGCANNTSTSTCPTVTNGQVQTSGCSFPTTASPNSTVCSDARRVVVAVVLDDHGRLDLGPYGPVYESAVFSDPSPSNQPSSSIGFTLGVHIG